MLMPISPATCWFCDVARIAMPSLVLYTSSSSPAIIATDATMIAICTLVMVAPLALSVMCYGTTVMICGNAIGLRLQMIIARCCRMIDTPMAVISGASRGARRSGRYATRSSV